MAGTLFWIDAIQVFIGAEDHPPPHSMPSTPVKAGWRDFASRSYPM
jgi:hypothetical protein